jgi:hypothetical protein
VFGFTITDFSVRTGKPIQVLYKRRTGTEAASTAVYWVDAHGAAMIAIRGPVFGVQTPTTFTPLPPSTQRLFTGPIPGSLSRLPAWQDPNRRPTAAAGAGRSSPASPASPRRR